MNEIDPDGFNAFEAAGWARQAGTYGAFVGLVTERLAEPLLDAAAVRAGSRVLDVATGPGYVASRAAERGAEVVAVDIAVEMLQLARAREPGVDFRRGDAQDLPFEDGSFDVVVCNFGLLHLGRPERATSEFARVLEPRGRVALTVWDEPSRNRWLGIMLDAVAQVGAEPPADLPVGPPIFRFADEAEFTAVLEGAGLGEVRVDTVQFDFELRAADDFWDGYLGGTVRTAPVLQAQTDEVKRQIRVVFDELVEEYRTDEGYEVPISVKLASGRKEG
jgi:SAM-dependent methyltransferase